MLKTIVSIFLVYAAAAGPQVPSVDLPILGFVVDHTHALRPLVGIAGSASTGAPLNLDFEITRAEIAPGQEYILAMTPGSNWPLLLQMRGNTISVQSIGEGMTIDRIALSPTGSAAAFFSESGQRVYVFTNLSLSPVLVAEFDIGQAGPLSSLGISDDARTIALGFSDGTAGSLFLVNLDGDRTPRLIAPMAHPSVISFVPGSSTAVIADDVEDKIYTLSDGQVFTTATAQDGISGPVGIAVSKDDQRIYVGNSASGSVTTIDQYGRAGETKYCNCALTGLHPTKADSVFRLTDFSGGPILLFDASAATPRIVFIRMGTL